MSILIISISNITSLIFYGFSYMWYSGRLIEFIKKNYKYVTGMDGEIQKYQYKFNKYTDSELNGLYWIKMRRMFSRG